MRVEMSSGRSRRGGGGGGGGRRGSAPTRYSRYAASLIHVQHREDTDVSLFVWNTFCV